MHITNLEYVQIIRRQSDIAGGELPVEFFRARINALKQEIELSSQDIASRRQSFSGGGSASSRSSGGSFSRTRIVVPTEPDISAVVIAGTTPG